MKTNTLRAAALGFFDGIHKGHKNILGRTAALAAEKGLVPSVVTFSTHPRTLTIGMAPPMISTPEERRSLIRAAGIEDITELDFDLKLAGTSAEDFAVFLARDLGCRLLICGENFRFGRGASGDPELLRQIGMKEGFEVEVCEPVICGGSPISSTRIRRAVAEGRMEDAAELLGRTFTLSGPVVNGTKTGRRIGFPTVNLGLHPGILLPMKGVYATSVEVDGTIRPGITNVGTRPTFSSADLVTVETFILDFEGDLYGKDIRVSFFSRLRGEKQFASPAELAAQISSDIEKARSIVRKHI